MDFNERHARNRQEFPAITIVEDPTYELQQLLVDSVRLALERGVDERIVGLERALVRLREDLARAATAQMELEGRWRDNREQLQQERKLRIAMADELHQLLAYVASEGTMSLPPLNRYVGLHVYVGNPMPSADKVDRLLGAATRFVEALGFEIVDDPDPVIGSLVKRWWLAIKYAVAGIDPDKAIQEAIAKAKLALELRTIDGPQAEVTSKLASAATELLGAMKDCDGPIVMKVGTLLALQAQDAQGTMHRLVLELTPAQARLLTNRPDLLAQPEMLLRWVQDTVSSSISLASASED